MLCVIYCHNLSGSGFDNKVSSMLEALFNKHTTRAPNISNTHTRYFQPTQRGRQKTNTKGRTGGGNRRGTRNRHERKNRGGMKGGNREREGARTRGHTLTLTNTLKYLALSLSKCFFTSLLPWSQAFRLYRRERRRHTNTKKRGMRSP